MFIDTFFANAQADAPTKTVGSDCSTAKKTCATFFSAHNQEDGDKNPHFYNLGAEQPKHCERLNMKISKLKSRTEHLKAVKKGDSGKNGIAQNNQSAAFVYKSQRENFNLNVLGMLLEDQNCDAIAKMEDCVETTKTTACSDVETRCEAIEGNLNHAPQLNGERVVNADKRNSTSILQQKTTNISAQAAENDKAKDVPVNHHNKLIDFIKQHHYATPMVAQKNKPNMSKNCMETPFDGNKQALKAKNFHVFADKLVFDYQLNSTYKVGRMIGKGSFAEVRLATRICDEKLVAIKSFPNSSSCAQQVNKVVQNEIRVLKSIDHPNIVKLLDIVATKDYIHIVLEYCDGLNLYEYMYNRGGKQLSESLARRIFIQLLNAMNYLHMHNIYHRDLKLDNIMIDKTGKVTIIDFGFAIQASGNTKITSFCGTPFYMAPEIYQRMSYSGAAVDLWALTVILYKLTVGEFPFKKTSADSTPKTSIIEVKYIVPSDLSKGLIEIFRQVFVKNAESRLSMSHLLQSQWLYREAN